MMLGQRKSSLKLGRGRAGPLGAHLSGTNGQARPAIPATPLLGPRPRSRCSTRRSAASCTRAQSARLN